MKGIDFRKELEKRQGKLELIQDEITRAKKELKISTRGLIKCEEAKEIVKDVGLKTQEQLQFHISDITSLALNAIFPNPYKLEADFVERRNQTECDLYFSREGERVSPLESSGGGAVDVAAFALRIASWSLEFPRKRNVMILDEPTKWVSEEYRDKVSAMLKEVSERLKIQFIVVTHDPRLALHADKTFMVSQKDLVSKVVAK